MIIEYHRPDTVENALALLAREYQVTLPLAGGTSLVRSTPQPFAVVDLQNLGLDRSELRGKTIELGAMLTLQSLLEMPSLPPGLAEPILQEAALNLRQAATLAGTLVAADGRSPLATAMLALDARLFVLPGVENSLEGETVGYGELLPQRKERLRSRLITSVVIPLNLKLAYHCVSRTPADLPLVCAAMARWPSGRTRLALGGWGSAPVLVLDGPEAGEVTLAAQDAYCNAGDEWAGAEYRSMAAGTLAQRCLNQLLQD